MDSSFLLSAFLSLLDLFIKVAMNDPQLLLVAISESPLLFIEDGFNVLCYPGFVIWVKLHGSCSNINVHTEINIVSFALSQPVYVLSMWLTKHI